MCPTPLKRQASSHKWKGEPDTEIYFSLGGLGVLTVAQEGSPISHFVKASLVKEEWAGWHPAHVWTCLGHMEFRQVSQKGITRGRGEACQIFVLGEEARSMPSFSFMSLFPSLPASWTSLPPPSTINCIKILGGGMESSSIRTGCWWIQLCRQSQQLSFQKCNSHAMLRSQHLPPPEPSPSLSIPSTMFSEPWRAWYKHLICGWASDCHLFSILCPVRSRRH